MGHFTDTYEIKSEITSQGIDFFFLSEGRREIIKVVQYSYVRNFQGKELYNIAFGDYDYNTDSYSDDVNSNNGDHYSVYRTVLATIPLFFQLYKYAMLMVRGSDSTREFQDNCRTTCERKCFSASCKKAHRRINIYRNFLDKNFEDLTREYEFLGDPYNDENQILTEAYNKGKKYVSIFIKKRKFKV